MYFENLKKSCCICCGKRNYEKNDYQFDITSENGIENKEWISIMVLWTDASPNFSNLTTAKTNTTVAYRKTGTDFDAFSFMITSDEFL